MPTQFPNAVDDFTNPTPASSQQALSHAGQHSDANDAIEAIETELLRLEQEDVQEINQTIIVLGQTIDEAEQNISQLEQDISQRGRLTLNFGAIPTYSKLFTVAFPGIAAGKTFELFHVFIDDEDEMDGLILRAYTTNSFIHIYADAYPGPIVGEFEIGYRYF